MEEDRYRLLARNIDDVITRHRRDGTVRFASPAAEPLFGVPPKALLGHGLFDRVHVADRPAYLTALSHAATQGASSSVEFRIRREAPGEPDAPAALHLGRHALPSARPRRRETTASAKWSPRCAT